MKNFIAPEKDHLMDHFFSIQKFVVTDVFLMSWKEKMGILELLEFSINQQLASFKTKKHLVDILIGKSSKTTASSLKPSRKEKSFPSLAGRFLVQHGNVV